MNRSARAHIGLAQAARQASLYKDALQSARYGRSRRHERCGSEEDEAQISYVRGNVYFPLGRVEEALKANEKAL